MQCFSKIWSDFLAVSWGAATLHSLLCGDTCRTGWSVPWTIWQLDHAGPVRPVLFPLALDIFFTTALRCESRCGRFVLNSVFCSTENVKRPKMMVVASYPSWLMCSSNLYIALTVILTYLDISWHILTYLDISWHILTYLDISWHPWPAGLLQELQQHAVMLRQAWLRVSALAKEYTLLRWLSARF